MLQKRIFPCLLINSKKELIKSVNFKERNYLGDIINAVKIFNEKKADELLIIDIDASRYCYEPDFNLIQKLASLCRMPLCYGGGIKTFEEASKIFNLGVEKILISYSFFQNQNFIRELLKNFGSQSISVCFDLFRDEKKSEHSIYVLNASKKIPISVKDAIKKAQELGVGEIVFNSINNDGKMKGYDYLILEKYLDYTNVPVVLLGGAGDISHIEKVVQNNKKNIAAACGSFFVYKGIHKAVLINYLSNDQKKYLNT